MSLDSNVRLLRHVRTTSDELNLGRIRDLLVVETEPEVDRPVDSVVDQPAGEPTELPEDQAEVPEDQVEVAEAAEPTEDVEEPAEPDELAESAPVGRRVSRRTALTATAVALAASAVFFGGIGSVVMHEAMPMSAMMKGQHHTMSDGATMNGAPMSTGTMPTNAMTNTNANARSMPGNPPNTDTAPAVSGGMPTADLGPVRPGGPGRAMPIPAAAASGGSSTTGQSTAATSGNSTATTNGSTSTSHGTSTAQGSASATSSHTMATVQSGDDFGSIGARYGISAQRVAALNPGLDPTQLSIGESVRVQ